MKYQLKGCYFKGAVEVQVALKIALHFIHGDNWQEEEDILKAVSKDFLVQPDLRYGSCTRPF
jgi:hypothetical protein